MVYAMPAPPEAKASDRPASETEASAGLWLADLTPKLAVGLVAFVALLYVAAAAVLATRQPSLGIAWSAGGVQGLIARSDRRETSLQPGHHVRALREPGGTAELLDGDIILEDPRIHATYADYNRFFARQERVANVLKQPRVELMRTAGDAVTVESRTQRPLRELPYVFWIYNSSGTACLLIGAGVWSYRRGDVAAECFALAGLGFFGAMLCLSVYATREMALEPQLFHVLSAANHLFMLLFTYSLLALLWYFPRRLGNVRRRTMAAVYAGAALVWLNDTQQWYEVPGHAFYVLTFVVPFLLGAPLLVAQWRHARRRPLDRGALQWHAIAVFATLAAVTMVLAVAPIHVPAIPLSIPTAALLVLAMFCVVALGMTRADPALRSPSRRAPHGR